MASKVAINSEDLLQILAIAGVSTLSLKDHGCLLIQKQKILLKVYVSYPWKSTIKVSLFFGLKRIKPALRTQLSKRSRLSFNSSLTLMLHIRFIEHGSSPTQHC